jgi:hypothetical protein
MGVTYGEFANLSSNPVYSSLSGYYATVLANTLTAQRAGDVSVQVVIASNSCYNAFTARQNVSVNRATPTLIFNEIEGITCFTETFNLVASDNYSSSITFSSSDPSIISVVGSVATVENSAAGGSATITASIAMDEYRNSVSVDRVVTITKDTPILYYEPIVSIDIGAVVPVNVSADVSSLAITLNTATPARMSISGMGVVGLSSGAATLVVTVVGDACYFDVVETFPIYVKKLQTLTLEPIGTKVLEAGTFTVSGFASSGLPVSYSTTTPGLISIAGNVVTMLATGTAVLIATQAGDLSYSAAPSVATTFIIGRLDVVNITDVSGLEGVIDAVTKPPEEFSLIDAVEVYEGLVAVSIEVAIVKPTSTEMTITIVSELGDTTVPEAVYNYNFEDDGFKISELDFRGQDVELTNIQISLDVMNELVVTTMNEVLGTSDLIPVCTIDMKRYVNVESDIQEIEGKEAPMVSMKILHPYTMLKLIHVDNDGTAVDLDDWASRPENRPNNYSKNRIDSQYWRITVPFSTIIVLRGIDEGEERFSICADPFAGPRNYNDNRDYELYYERKTGKILACLDESNFSDYTYTYNRRRKISKLS